jgi:hypothetical protein
VDQELKDCALTTAALLSSLHANTTMGGAGAKFFGPNKVYWDAATAVERTILLAGPF